VAGPLWSHLRDRSRRCWSCTSTAPSRRGAADRAIRRHDLRAVTPVLCGSAFKNKGVQPMLDAIVDYLPSRWTCPHQGPRGGSEQDEIDGTPTAPSRSPARGSIMSTSTCKLTYLRIYSGTLEAGKAVLNSTRRKERIGKIYQMHATARGAPSPSPADRRRDGLKDTSTATPCRPGQR